MKGNVGNEGNAHKVHWLATLCVRQLRRHIYTCTYIQYFIKISLLTITITFITLQSI